MPTAAEQATRVNLIQEMLETLIDNPDSTYSRRALFANSKFKQWQQDILKTLIERGVIRKSGKANNPVYSILQPDVADSYIEQRVPLSQLAYPNHQPPSMPEEAPIEEMPPAPEADEVDEADVPPEVVAQHTLKLLPRVVEHCVELQKRIDNLEKKIDYLTSLWTSSESE